MFWNLRDERMWTITNMESCEILRYDIGVSGIIMLYTNVSRLKLMHGTPLGY